jgi:hypothetical protein
LGCLASLLLLLQQWTPRALGLPVVQLVSIRTLGLMGKSAVRHDSRSSHDDVCRSSVS